MKTKIFIGTDYCELEDKISEFLINKEVLFISTNYNEGSLIITILYFEV